MTAFFNDQRIIIPQACHVVDDDVFNMKHTHEICQCGECECVLNKRISYHLAYCEFCQVYCVRGRDFHYDHDICDSSLVGLMEELAE